MNILCYIPARGGSKGIPHKNITHLGDKPLLAWSVEAAANSRYVTRIVVDTDSPDIAAVAKQFGAETPYLRPAHLAGDADSLGAAKSYCIQWLWDNEYYVPDIIVTMFATSPFRTPSDIDAVVGMLLDGASQHAQTVTYHTIHLDQMLIDTDQGMAQVTAFLPQGIAPKIQGFTPLMLVEAERHPGNHPVDALVELHDPVRRIDIDTLDDLALAEQVLRDGLFDVTPFGV